MSVQAPKFSIDPHFYVDDDGFHLMPGAPDEIQKEFDEFMEEYRKQEEEGKLI